MNCWLLSQRKPERLSRMKAALLEHYAEVRQEGPTWPSMEPKSAD